MDHFKVTIVMNIRMHLKLKVARTPQFGIAVIRTSEKKNRC